MNMDFRLYDPRFSIGFLILALTLSSTSRAQSTGAYGGKPDTDKTITNSIGMKLVLIPAGELMMGKLARTPELKKVFSRQCKPYGISVDGEYPQHRVRITKSFYLGGL